MSTMIAGHRRFQIKEDEAGEDLGDRESVSKLLQRKHVVPVTRRPGPASESAFRIVASRCSAADPPFSKRVPVSPVRKWRREALLSHNEKCWCT